MYLTARTFWVKGVWGRWNLDASGTLPRRSEVNCGCYESRVEYLHEWDRQTGRGSVSPDRRSFAGGFALPGVDVCVVGMTFDRVEKPHTKSLFALAVDGLLVGLLEDLMLSSGGPVPLSALLRTARFWLPARP